MNGEPSGVAKTFVDFTLSSIVDKSSTRLALFQSSNRERMKKLFVTVLVGISALTVARGDAIVIKGSNSGSQAVCSWRGIEGATSGERPLILRRKGTYAEFKELAMKKRDYAPDSQKLAGNEQIAK